MTIIDARVRLPQDRRGSSRYNVPARQAEQYDRVLDLTEKINAGTLAGLLAVLDAEGVDRAGGTPSQKGRER